MIAEDQKKAIGLLIKKARIKKDLTQIKVAEKTNISRNYISDIENGRYMPSVSTLIVLARFLEIDLNLLPKMTEIQDKNNLMRVII